MNTEKQDTFTDASFDQGSQQPSDTLGSKRPGFWPPDLSAEPRPGLIGERTFPAQQGFLYADTPEATVFIRKKEWIEDSWTYPLSFAGLDQQQQKIEDINGTISGTEQQIRDLLNKDLKAQLVTFEVSEAVATRRVASGRSNPTSGTIFNITTIDEQTGILSPSLLSLLSLSLEEFVQIVSDRTTKENIIKSVGAQRVKQLNSIGSFQVARWRTTAFELLAKSQSRQLTAITIDSEFAYDPPLTIQSSVYGSYLRAEDRDAFEDSKALTDDSIKKGKQKDIVSEETTVNLIGIADDQALKAIAATLRNIRKNLINEFKQLQEQQKLAEQEQEALEKKKKSIDASARLQENEVRNLLARIIRRKIEWISGHEKFAKVINATQALADFVDISEVKSFQESARNLEGLAAIEFPAIASAAPAFTKFYTGGKGFTDADFNGLLELGNVSSITTSISTTGQGTATITIESPQNIFYISRDDIEIALGTLDVQLGFDPFLQTTDGLGTAKGDLIIDQASGTRLRYFRGRYYTDRAFELVTKDLVAENPTLNSAILGLASFSPTENSRGAIVDVGVPTEQDRRSEVFNFAQRYFQGKYIFEILDKIYVWTTSPSKTLFNVPNGEGSFIASMESGDPQLLHTLRKLEKDQQQAEIERKRALEDKNNIEAKIQQRQTDATQVNRQQEIEILQVELKAKKEELAAKEKKVNNINARVDATSAELQNTRADTFSTNEAVDIRVDEAFPTENFSSKYTGLNEQKFQIFEGVVTQVSQTYSNGTYQLTLSCADNSYYLSISTIMRKPALTRGGLGINGILNDPVHVVSDKDGKKAGRWKSGLCAASFAFASEQVAKIIEENDPKSFRAAIGGVQDIALIDQQAEKEAIEKQKDLLGAKKRRERNFASINERRIYDNFTVTEPFAGIDAANVVSITVTGIPYNLENFLANAFFGGTLNVDIDPLTQSRKLTANNRQSAPSTTDKNPQNGIDGLTDNSLLQGSFFVQLLQDIQENTNRWGDFEPYALSLATNQSLEALDKEIVKRKEKLGSKDVPFTDIVLRSQSPIPQAPLPIDESWTNFRVELLKISLNTARNNLQAKQLFSTEDARVIIDTISTIVDTIAIEKIISGATADTRLREKFSTRTVSNNIKSIYLGYAPDRDNQQPVSTQIDAQLISNSGQVIVTKTRITTIEFIAAVIDSKGVQTALSQLLNDAFVVGTAEAKRSLLVKVEKKLGERFNLSMYERLTALDSSLERIINNVKKNFLVISHEYSGNSDIEIYNRVVASQGNYPLWQSDFTTPKDLCSKAAEQLDFEFYADSQGHLQFKPQTYNRILPEHLPLVLAESEFGTVTKKLREAYPIIFDEDAKLSDAQSTRSFISEVAIRQQQFVQSAQLPDGSVPASLLGRQLASGIDFSKLEQFSPDIIADSAKFGLLTEAERIYGDVERQITTALNSQQFLAVPPNERQQQKFDVEAFIRSVFLIRINDNLIKVDAHIKSIKDGSENSYDELSRWINPDRIHRVPDAIIISENFTENSPDYTRIDVTGAPDVADLGDVAFYWAGAVDYDLWRQYGFTTNTINKAYFHNGLACKQYALFLLARQRGRILQGTLTVRGDSKYRLGDCIFAESRFMYYYVSGISHSFTYGESYTTTLTLTYGRRPGTFIPHPFDGLGLIVKEGLENDCLTDGQLEKINNQAVINQRPKSVKPFIKSDVGS